MRQLIASVFVVATLATPALADEAPPPDYVEKCTEAKQKKPGETCTMCGDAYHGERDACSKVYEPKGYELRCRTRGASTWKELWCKADPKAEPAPKKSDKATPVQQADVAPSKKKGCEAAGSDAGAPLAMLAALGLLLAVRRRS